MPASVKAAEGASSYLPPRMCAEAEPRGPLLRPEGIARHFEQRFAQFQGERVEQLMLLQARRQAFLQHHRVLQELAGLRADVGRLQRRLTEVQVQTVRERMRALRRAAERRDFGNQYSAYCADVRRLVPVQPGRAAASAACRMTGSRGDGGGLVSAPSRCVVRLIATPHDEGLDAETEEQEVWLQIEDQAKAHAEELDAVDSQRAAAEVTRKLTAAALTAELQGELEEVAAEHERLATSLQSILQLRMDDADARWTRAQAVDALRRRNTKLTERAKEAAHLGRREASELEVGGKADAGGHLEFRRRVEILERQGTAALCATLEAVQEKAESRVATLLEELRALRSRCASQRRQRRLTLEGLEADLSLVGKKLSILAGVAEKACERVVTDAMAEGPRSGSCLRCFSAAANSSAACRGTSRQHQRRVRSPYHSRLALAAARAR